MKLLVALYAFVLLAGAGVRAAFPLMPENVANGGEALRTLWTTASQGTFMNVLTHNMRSIQGPWTEFLTTEGEQIFNNYYREAFRDKHNAAILHGHSKFIRMVKFAITEPYRFQPESDAYKPKVAATLISTFADRLAAARQAELAKDLRRPPSLST
ncbi:hypothetical protein PANT_5c00145 [Moesziomyces antarcticus T-34]|uniref:Uncharacterized protein n=1 Tax=Pseudozyma antarctica (strain T-34) TaxID=1151754 RepID=M9LTE9_PSEA3|nr:hypothetical protein PANT_5c00145 [Moesziomyces antarcticus T-34]